MNTMNFAYSMREAAKLLEQSGKRELYKTDAALWALECLGVHLWSKQVEISKAMMKHKKVGVSSCHGSGKSFTATVLILWWVCTRMNDDTIAIVTAPTYSQVHAIIFEGMRKLHQQRELPGTITMADNWNDAAGNLVAMGRKPADTNAHAFQGIHRTGGVAVIIDEACGVDETIFTGAEAITTGYLDRILAIFNPDDISSYIGKVWLRKDPSWFFMEISAYDTPNFTGEWVPEYARNGLISHEWAEEKKESWGEDSARYQSKVLGKFSLNSSENNLFTQLDLAKAIETELIPSLDTTPILGCDIARFGSDLSTAYSNTGGVLRKEGDWSKSDTVESAEKIHDIAIRIGAKEVRVDGIGIGAGVYDQLTRMAQGQYEIVGMIGNGASPDPSMWLNARASWFDGLREKMHTGKIDMDGDDKKLKEELEGIQYTFSRAQNSIQIESKDDMKKRGIKSPDFADAAAYACADLGIDPTDPASKLAIGETIHISLEEALYGMQLSISPY